MAAIGPKQNPAQAAPCRTVIFCEHLKKWRRLFRPQAKGGACKENFWETIKLKSRKKYGHLVGKVSGWRERNRTRRWNMLR